MKEPILFEMLIYVLDLKNEFQNFKKRTSYFRKFQNISTNSKNVYVFQKCRKYKKFFVDSIYLKTWIQTMFTTSEQVRELLVFSWFGEMFRNYKSSQVQK